ncbi:flagella basal body P-ring formation protein FlgA [Pacificibacter maritimus]|uniref:Flagella basal body P-ring formation protein FlgA n=1 Tax=Pacificibacter maritimus TaxID=762213 RepID=A0A3N4U461_9RHOB|nr:flagellar basal body P-ring formation chaperone FlgA [Pacificibacter maritimus]RPE64618.1 flagella basal body P-ring formation protein FlgA [Pacificibacter maritimus]
MKYLAIISLLICLCPNIVFADVLIANRTIRAQTVLSAADVSVAQGDVAGSLVSIDEAIGLEARVAIYAGRPVMAGDVGAAAIIERNQIVKLVYLTGSLSIYADARALGRAGPGDLVRVMNLTSKSTVSGIVAADGSVYVGNLPQS